MSDERRGSAINPLQLPQALGGLVGDIRRIADQMETMVAAVIVLPQVAKTLATIEDRVDTLNDEVIEMHVAVEAMRSDVTELKAGIERVEPQLEEMTRIVHPLRRITDRARRRGREDELADAVDDETQELADAAAQALDDGVAEDPRDPIP